MIRADVQVKKLFNKRRWVFGTANHESPCPPRIISGVVALKVRIALPAGGCAAARK